MSFTVGPTASFLPVFSLPWLSEESPGNGVGAVFLLIRFLQDLVQCSALRLDNPRCKIYS